MGILQLEKGQVLHKAGKDEVHTLEVLIKGSIRISNQFSSITLDAGGFIGIVETPGRPYLYTCEAMEETVVYSYPYESVDDIPGIVRSNPRIAPVLAAQCAESTATVCAIYENQFDDTLAEYEKIISDKADYRILCQRVGTIPKVFPELEYLIPPEKSGNLKDWIFDYSDSLKENSDILSRNFYPLSVELCVGMVMTCYTIFKLISDETVMLNEYRKALAKQTKDFVSEMKKIHIMLNDLQKLEAVDVNGNPVILDALNTILAYSGVSGEIAGRFQDEIAEFRNSKGRYDFTDEARTLRRKLTGTFYEVFLPCFLRSLTDDNIPIEVKMFFMFGFVDEELAGEKCTAMLYRFARDYTPDPEGNVLTLYEWLRKIYLLEEMPSKNEFDQDWPAYLREQKISGAITQEKLDAVLNNPLKRLDFEIKNLFSLGNRMTFGRVSSFVPVFDEANVLRPLDMAYVDASKVNDYFSEIRSVDFGVFCRDRLFSDPDIGITQLYCANDITPYMILMPNIGNRATLWQEIDGKNRHTRARMLVSIFNTENTQDLMIRLFGEFRWDMCKAMQGIRWNDVTNPSLTSRYSDYLQYYRKNSSLTAANKDKIRADLKKHNNKFRNLFIADYLAYIKYESTGSPRLNKYVREILFNYCPFAKDIRESLKDSPQYAKLITNYNSHIERSIKSLSNMAAKLERKFLPVPDEITKQIEYLSQ